LETHHKVVDVSDHVAFPRNRGLTTRSNLRARPNFSSRLQNRGGAAPRGDKAPRLRALAKADTAGTGAAVLDLAPHQRRGFMAASAAASQGIVLASADDLGLVDFDG
jgi:hypothetical protein